MKKLLFLSIFLIFTAIHGSQKFENQNQGTPVNTLRWQRHADTPLTASHLELFKSSVLCCCILGNWCERVTKNPCETCASSSQNTTSTPVGVCCFTFSIPTVLRKSRSNSSAE